MHITSKSIYLRYTSPTVGGYQPAQKWLKDRKGRKLTNQVIEHYQKIIAALTETNRIMSEIDNIIDIN